MAEENVKMVSDQGGKKISPKFSTNMACIRLVGEASLFETTQQSGASFNQIGFGVGPQVFQILNAVTTGRFKIISKNESLLHNDDRLSKHH